MSSQSSQDSLRSSSLENDIYSGAASFGLFYTLIGAIIGTIVGIIMIISGIFMLNKKLNIELISGKVLNLNCRPLQNNEQNCSINISYRYNNLDYTNYIQYTGKNIYASNQLIDIYVNKDNATVIYIEDPDTHGQGRILLFSGLFIILAGWIWYWISKKYKFLAAAEGVSGAFNLFSRR